MSKSLRSHPALVRLARVALAYSNPFNYSNPKTDVIIDAYRREIDLVKRIAEFHDLQRVVMTDLPVIPVMNAPFLHCTTKRSTGWIQPLTDRAPR